MRRVEAEVAEKVDPRQGIPRSLRQAVGVEDQVAAVAVEALESAFQLLFQAAPVTLPAGFPEFLDLPRLPLHQPADAQKKGMAEPPSLHSYSS